MTMISLFWLIITITFSVDVLFLKSVRHDNGFGLKGVHQHIMLTIITVGDLMITDTVVTWNQITYVWIIAGIYSIHTYLVSVIGGMELLKIIKACFKIEIFN